MKEQIHELSESDIARIIQLGTWILQPHLFKESIEKIASDFPEIKVIQDMTIDLDTI
jgi:hypothetical protein